MADDGTRKLGPGTLSIGATGSEVDISCLINSATITADKNEGDSTTKLCGITKPGAITYNYHFDGNVDTDIALSTGIFALSQTHPGEEFAFTYSPNSDIVAPLLAATEAAGTLVIDPLDFGGDTMGEYMNSDFSFTIVGQPAYTYADGLTPTGVEAPATGSRDTAAA